MDLRAGIEHAVRRLEPGGRVQKVRRLTGGVSANVYGIDITTSGGTERRVVFRQHRSASFKSNGPQVATKEYQLLVALHREGFAVPEPYLVDDGGMVTAPYLITEWIAGSTEVTAHELSSALEQMAQFLSALHSLDPGALTVAELEPIEDPAVAIDQYLPETDTGLRARAALRANRLGPERNRPVLLHGDYWPGNVMWRDGQLAAVLDWEDACLGSPLADLATARVELLCQHGAIAMERFTTEYLAMTADADRLLELAYLPVWEAYVSAAALSSMHAWGLDPADEAHRRHTTEQFFRQAARRL